MVIQPGGVLELPFTREASLLAEVHIRERLETFLQRSQLENVVLVTSEIVANALRTGRPPIRLHVMLIADPPSVRIVVTDDAAGPDHAGDRSEPGFGTATFDVVATRWGVEHPTGGGRTVWMDVVA